MGGERRKQKAQGGWISIFNRHNNYKLKLGLKNTMFFKKKPKPFEGLSVTTRGFDENKFFNVRKESDLYNLSPGDTIRICVDYYDNCLDPKYLEINHLIFFKHRLGRDYFLANYQKGLVEYSGKRKNIKVMEKSGFGHFILLDKKEKKQET